MNAPDSRDFARIVALGDLSVRIMGDIAPQVDLLAEADQSRTLLDFLTAMERQGYQVRAPYRGYPSAQLGREEWRIPITRPDGIQLELTFFLRPEPVPPKRKS